MASVLYKGITVNYDDQGKGTAVVLLHGFLENRKMWMRLAEVLLQKFRVITIDLLGHGGTPSLGYIHSMEQNADIVHAVLREVRVRKAWVGGHSMGGYVTLAFAEAYPSMLKGIILINSTAAADSTERKVNRDRAIVAVKKDHSTFVRLAVGNLFGEENRDRLKAEIEHVRNEALKTPLQGIVASLEGMKIRKDRQHIVQNGSFPTLLILGEKDPVLQIDEILEQGLPVETKIVDGGHMSHLENEHELKDAVVKFIS